MGSCFDGHGSYLKMDIRMGCPHAESRITIGNELCTSPLARIVNCQSWIVFRAGKGRGTFTKQITLEDELGSEPM